MTPTASRRRLPDGRTVWSINRNETDYLHREIFEDQVYVTAEWPALPPAPVVLDGRREHRAV